MLCIFEFVSYHIMLCSKGAIYASVVSYFCEFLECGTVGTRNTSQAIPHSLYPFACICTCLISLIYIWRFDTACFAHAIFACRRRLKAYSLVRPRNLSNSELLTLLESLLSEERLDLTERRPSEVLQLLHRRKYLIAK